MSAPVKLFGRIVTVEVDTLSVSDLRIAFKIEKSLTKNPNTLDLVIYNLNDTSRRQIQSKGAHVRVDAGYLGTIETLFVGDAAIINHARQGPDWISRLQSGDGVSKLRSNYVSASFAPGTQVKDAMKAIADATGLALGNVVSELEKGNVRNALTTFSKGFVASGPAGDSFAKIARTMGYEFSVQDGAIQLSQPGQPVGDVIVALRADTGLIGSPETAEVSADVSGTGDAASGKKKTIIKVRSLIQQKLMPGRAVQLQSDNFNGIYRIEKVTFTGDTHAQPWYVDLELCAVAI